MPHQITGLDATGHRLLAAHGQEGDLFAVDAGDDRHGLGILIPQEVAHGPQLGGVHAVAGGGENMEVLHRLGGGQELPGLAQRRLGLELLQRLTQLLHLVGLLLHPLQQPGGGGFQELGRPAQHALTALHGLQAQLAAGGLDAAHAGGDAALTLDAEGTGLGGVVHMGAAAELRGEVAHLYHPDGLAVLLTEHGHGALLFSLLDGQYLRHHGIALQNGVVHQFLHLPQLLRGDGLKVGEVEAQAVRLHQRARLMDVVAQHLLQRRIQQVGSAVSTLDGLAALHINGGVNGVSHVEHTLCQMAVVHELAALVFLYVRHGEHHAVGGDGAVVGHLTAHLGVEGGLIQHHHGLGSGGYLFPQLLIGHDGHDLGVVFVVVIAHEFRGRHVLAEFHTGPAQIAQSLPGLTGSLLLLLHQLLESALVHAETLIGRHLHGQVDGEAEGIVQPEGVGAGENFLQLLLVLCQQVGEDLHAAVDGAAEILLLRADDLGDIGLLFPQIGVLPLVLMDHGVHHLIQEGIVDAQQLPVAGGPAQQTPQHIAPPLVGGQDAVADHEGSGADVVGDDPQGHIPLLRLAVVSAGELRHLVGDIHHGVHVEQAVHVLAHAGQTLQTHAGVDVLLLELRVVAVAIVVELGEHVVPDLDVSVTVAAHGAAGLAAAVLRPTVIVDLGAGAAGTGAVLPEVVLLAEAEDALGGDAHLLVPDVEGLVVVQIDGGVQPVRLQPHHLSQELPAPCDGLVLEVVAEGEVAQHLEVGAVAGGLAHVLNVTGADALLTGADPAAGRLLLALEPRLHGGHAGVDEQDGLVVLRHQREAGQPQMTFGLEERQEHLPQLIESVIGMRHDTLLLLLAIGIAEFSFVTVPVAGGRQPSAAQLSASA